MEIYESQFIKGFNCSDNLRVYNKSSIDVSSETICNFKNRLDVSRLNKGIYILTVIKSGTSHYYKFIKI